MLIRVKTNEFFKDKENNLIDTYIIRKNDNGSLDNMHYFGKLIPNNTTNLLNNENECFIIIDDEKYSKPIDFKNPIVVIKNIEGSNSTIAVIIEEEFKDLIKNEMTINLMYRFFKIKKSKANLSNTITIRIDFDNDAFDLLDEESKIDYNTLNKALINNSDKINLYRIYSLQTDNILSDNSIKIIGNIYIIDKANAYAECKLYDYIDLDKLYKQMPNARIIFIKFNKKITAFLMNDKMIPLFIKKYIATKIIYK